MSAFITLAGKRVTEGRITHPECGPWHADVTVENELVLEGVTSLVIGSDTYACATWRTPHPFSGSTRVRVIGGFGGWRTSIGTKFYRQPGGVKLSLVLGDAASEVGERVSIVADRDIGPFFTRDEGPAQRILRRYADAWHVRADGVTVVGPREASRITTPFELVSFDGVRGCAVVASERLGDWAPGRTFVSARAPGVVFTIAGVEHVIVGANIRTEVYLA